MLLRKPMKIFLTLAVLLGISMNTITAQAGSPDMDRKGSVAVDMKNPDTDEAINGGEFAIYQVAGIQIDDADLSYELTEQFAGSKVDLTTLDNPGLADELEEYATDNELVWEAKEELANGKVLFADLKPGLYLVVQTEASKGYYPAKPFLVSVPVKSADGAEWIYDVDATPKTEVKADESWKPVDMTVKKVWEGEGKKHPASVTAGLYDGDELVEKVILSEENHWSHTWTELDGSKTWNVKEINVPKGYVVSYEKTDTTVTMKNTGSLIQTGQLNWPVPVLAFVGLILILTGFVLLQNKRKA